MKKEYVKPVMESEEFVANEYVAACWKYVCHGYNTKINIDRNSHEAHGPVSERFDTKQAVTETRDFDFIWTWASEPAYTDSKGVKHYTVSCDDVSTSAHPNASA